MENYLLPVLEEGGPLGAVVVLVVLGVGFYLRQKGWLTGDGTKVVSTSQLSDLSTKVDELTTEVGGLGRRMDAVERDIEDLPTRAEIHRLEITHAEMQGQIRSLDKAIGATTAGVIRIENYLIELSKGGLQK